MIKRGDGMKPNEYSMEYIENLTFRMLKRISEREEEEVEENNN